MRNIHTVLLCLLLGAMMPGAQAAEIEVQVNDSHGQPVPDAVVTLVPHAVKASPSPAPMRKVIDQKDLAFIPYIEVFRPGDEVVFRNSDHTRHHVYSFSKVRAFEFVLAPGESSPPQALDVPGVVAVGCNIHDQMVSYLYVSDAPWVARPDARGRAVLRNIPAGTYDVRVWQPRLRPSRPDMALSTTILKGSDAKTLTFSLVLLPDPRLQFDREHTRY